MFFVDVMYVFEFMASKQVLSLFGSYYNYTSEHYSKYSCELQANKLLCSECSRLTLVNSSTQCKSELATQ